MASDLPIFIPARVVEEYFNCSICLNTMVEPKMTACGHRFCNNCITEWVDDHHSCPCCNGVLDSARLFRDHQFDGLIEVCEKEIQHAESAYFDSLPKPARQNNFPPLPKSCLVRPCFYQDFSIDIPLEFQRIVKFVFFLWGAHVLVLFLNVWASLAYAIVDGDGGTTFGLSILWFGLFTPCSFVCWYRPLYDAFRSHSSFHLFVFLKVFFFQFCLYIIQCLGLTGFTVGWINGIHTSTDKNVAAGAFMLIVAFLFSLEAVVSFLVLMKVHCIYRSTGASFRRTQQEFAQGVMRNETVQTAATATAAAANANAAHGAVSSNYGSNNRY